MGRKDKKNIVKKVEKTRREIKEEENVINEQGRRRIIEFKQSEKKTSTEYRVLKEN